MKVIPNIDAKRVPSHVAIIMDGNGRWASLMGKPRIFGHKNGVQAVRESLEASVEAGVKCLTLYAFSTENWNRPAGEVNALMTLLVKTIRSEVDKLDEKGVCLNAIGDISKLPAKTYNALIEAIEKTKNNKKIRLVLALNYSGRWDISQAGGKLSRFISENKIDPNQVDESMFSQFLSTAEFPELELLIRTSGEQRLSNFLLWESAYAEFYFSEKFWPEFRKEDFFDAILDFQKRERRFGKTGEQLKAIGR
ncbi:MAG: isoprenyl transferase [Saprospirales bacterium]|nr:MAG: isoprenyl transferase [Saprospirales bacterium]